MKRLFTSNIESIRLGRITLACLCLLALVGVTGCPNREVHQSATQPFRITINSWIGFAPLYIAQEKGLFAKEGITVELTRIEDTGARKAAMIGDKVDAYGASVDGVA